MKLFKTGITVISLAIIAGLLMQCTSGNQPATENYIVPVISKKSLLEGKMLAGRYCRSCHQLPDPSLLP